MIKLSAFVILVALRIYYHPVYSPTETIPFASSASFTSSTGNTVPAKLISVNGSISNNKVILNWVVAENESADQFEVEKSTDGKNFTMAALVFGTDKMETGNYQFYEKASKQKTLYRIKLISKSHKEEYSDIIEIAPSV